MNQDIKEEKWRDIEDFEGLYAVSDRGRVMNLKSGRVLKPRVDSHGYNRVSLGRGNEKSLHRLVAQAFLENPNNLPQVHHKDEDPGNNDVSNLSWVTASQNTRHSTHKYSCKVNQYSLDGEFIRQWKSFHEIERELGFSNGSINMCCNGKLKTAYNYLWSYADGLHQQKHNRPIVVLTKDDDFVAHFKSAAEASRCLEISTTPIYCALKGAYKTTHGFKFKYADELTKNIINED